MLIVSTQCYYFAAYIKKKINLYPTPTRIVLYPVLDWNSLLFCFSIYDLTGKPHDMKNIF